MLSGCLAVWLLFLAALCVWLPHPRGTEQEASDTAERCRRCVHL